MKRVLILFCLSTILVFSSYKYETDYQDNYTALFEELCDTISQHFYNPVFIKKDFPGIKEHYLHKIQKVDDPGLFQTLCNQMLKEFKTSHTYLYSKEQVAYFQLASIFAPLANIKRLFENQEITYSSIGIFSKRIDNKVFVTGVLNGGVADQAGIKKGDELVTADGKPFHQIRSFKGKADKEVSLAIRKESAGTIEQITVVPQMVNPKEEFMQAIESSIRIIEYTDKKIGYIHMWNYAGEHFHQILVDAVAWGKLKEADALILDIRNGWGGASPDYLNLFNKNTPAISFEDREGKISSFDRIWRKPVVLLIDETVRSGKEVLAYGFKKYKIGPVIGENTAGAVTAGRLFVLSNRMILYLAVRMAKVDGEILEGKGVAPDILITNEIPYSNGKDAVLEKAISIF